MADTHANAAVAAPLYIGAGAGLAEREREAVRCFHCGETCRTPDFADFTDGEKCFCCRGCLIVHDLLNQSGLGHFYDLSAAPGVRIRREDRGNQFKYLDEPTVRERLLDFTDGRTSRVTFLVPAIHCVACVWLLENLFKLHSGIGRSQVNFPRREVSICFANEKMALSEVVTLLVSIGYEPELTLGETEKAAPSQTKKKAWLQIGLAAFAFGNIMLMSLPFYLGLDSVNGPWFREVAGWLSLLMALPVVVYSASDFWRAAWLSVRQRTLTLEVPIALGLAAIYGRSVLEVVLHWGPGYCDSLCGLIFFLLCGRLFQKKTYERMTFDRDYKGFFPLAIVRKTAQGEENVAIPQLKTGDHLMLRNGELLPADARLVSGDACMDYSFVTGESLPSAHAIGDHLYAGGRQVGGAIEVETIKPVAQSYLASLWNNDAFRKQRENDLDTLTNRYSRRFTRLVISIAVIAAAFWLFNDAGRALKAFTSVLIVACPCALALAAPLTHGTAQRLLARRKIFLKNAQVIEAMAGVDTIVLDKTGTLTSAEAHTVEFHSSRELGEDEIRWIGSVTRHSSHPHSAAITRWLGVAALPVRGFKETPGGGIEGEVGGHAVLLGSLVWLKQKGISGMERCPANETPASTVYLAMDGDFRGVFMLENSLRREVEKLISQASGQFELALLSGDNERQAARFHELFGADAILKFNQSPTDKLNFIRELQGRGRRVMMVGDGLNDAGALKQADVGVAVVERIGIFSPASDVILDAAELPGLIQVLEYSRQAARVVRAGFGISALYNVAGVSIAAAGLLAPVVCAVLMPLSTATIVIFSCAAATWAARRCDLLNTTFKEGTAV
jgi:Cu+-exporting ATPase